MISRLPFFVLITCCSVLAFSRMADAQMLIGYEGSKTLIEHDRGVTSLTFSPKADLLATGGWDKTLRLWKMPEGVLERTLIGHEDVVWSIAFSPDGKQIATGSSDDKIILWDTSNGKPLYTMLGHTEGVTSIAFSPDGTVLASGSFDKTIRLWSVSKGTLLKTLYGHGGRVTSIVFTRDGDMMVSASKDGTIKFWELTKPRPIHTMDAHRDGTNTLAFSPDGKMLVSAGEDGKTLIWSFETLMKPEEKRKKDEQEILQTIENPPWAVWSVTFSPDGKYLGVTGGDRNITIWNAKTGETYTTASSHNDVVTAIGFSSNKRFLATGSLDKTVKIHAISRY